MLKRIVELLRDASALERAENELAELRESRNALLDAYEALSRKYIYAIGAKGRQLPGLDLCVRTPKETYAYFRLLDDESLSRLEKFLANCGCGAATASKAVHPETGKPICTVYGGEFGKLVMPYNSVIAVNVDEKWDHLVLTESQFHDMFTIVS